MGNYDLLINVKQHLNQTNNYETEGIAYTHARQTG